MAARTMLLGMCWVAALFVNLQVSAALAQAIYQKVDAFSGTTHFYSKRRDTNLDGGSFFSSRYVSFDLSSFAGPGQSYSLGVHTFTGDWIFIKNGASIDLKLNGTDFMHLIGPGSLGSRSVISGSLVSENAYYAITREDLERIGHASSVEFRIYGERQTITGAVPKDFLTDAISFYELVPHNGETSPLKLGVHFIPLTPNAIAALHMDSDHGLLLIDVDAGSAAARAGLQKADVIISINDKPMTKAGDPAAVGIPKRIHLWRAGKELDVAIQ